MGWFNFFGKKKEKTAKKVIDKILVQTPEDDLFLEDGKIHAISSGKEYVYDVASVSDAVIITTDMGPMYCDMALAVRIEDEVAIFIMSDHPSYSKFLFDQLGKTLKLDYNTIIKGCMCIENNIFEIYKRESA